MGAKRDEKKAREENGSCMSFPTEQGLLYPTVRDRDKKARQNLERVICKTNLV